MGENCRHPWRPDNARCEGCAEGEAREQMQVEIGRVDALFRYPVKSMRGEQVETATLGWHGIDGDRRFAFRRLEERGGFPWLSAGRLPDLVSFTPLTRGDEMLVRTPEGEELPLFSEALAADVARRHRAPVQMMQLKHGIFDEASVSVIAAGTVAELARFSETQPDVRRFRPNILVRTTSAVPFEEDQWVGAVLTFGHAADAPAVTITLRDERCSMVNLDPDGGPPAPGMMKACVRANGNYAGVYATVTRTGELRAGQTIVLTR